MDFSIYNLTARGLNLGLLSYTILELLLDGNNNII